MARISLRSLPGVAVLATGLLLLDLLAPAGSAAGTAYVLLLLPALWWSDASFVWYAAGAGSLLLALGALRHAPAEPLPALVTHRVVALLILWIAAAAIYVSRRRTDRTASDLAAIIHSSTDAIIGKTTDGVITSWNPAAERMYGYRAAEAIGRSITMLLPEGAPDDMADILQRIRRGERVAPYETARRTRDGRLLLVSLSVSPVIRHGQIVGAAAIARDVTSERQAEVDRRQQEARLRSVVETAVDAIIVIDDHGMIETCNRSTERMFGYGADELVGQNVRVLMPAPHGDQHDEYLVRYLRTGEQRIIGIGREVTGRRKDGATFPAHLAVSEMSLEGRRKFTGIVRDLTERVRLEHALREQTTLAHLGEMAAVLAHEVRNAVAAVRGAIQIIGRRFAADSAEAPVVGEILTRLDGLTRLMQDLLLFARPPRPRRSLIDLAPLLEQTVRLIQSDPQWNRVDVRIAGAAPPVMADPQLLQVIFGNLLVNAAEAMRGHGTVRIDVAEADGASRVSVSDQGPGIPDGIRQEIFRPFFTTKQRGTGLGLPTVKRFVEAHAGTLAIVCPPEGGTTFVIDLPYSATGD